MTHPQVIRPAEHAVYSAEKMGKSTLFQSPRLLVGLNAFAPGQLHALHAHAGMDKVYSVIEGEGVFLLEGRELPMRAGDVLLFHSLCVHRGVPNTTPDRVRLSVDYRYQGISQPITPGSLLPHFNRRTWDEIYAGWERADLQYYWQRTSLSVVEFTRAYHESARRG